MAKGEWRERGAIRGSVTASVQDMGNWIRVDAPVLSGVEWIDQDYGSEKILCRFPDIRDKALHPPTPVYSNRLMCFSQRMVRRFGGRLAFAMLTLVGGLYAQSRPLVEIGRVDFETVRNEWLKVEVSLEANRNERPDARDRRYVDRVLVRCILSYEREKRGGFDFYTAQAEIVSLEQSDDKAVRFYLPGVLVERDRLRSDPFAYLIELEIAGEPQPLQENGVSANLRGNPAAVRSLRSRARTEGADNEGVLRPAYLAPASIQEKTAEPAYIRRTVNGR